MFHLNSEKGKEGIGNQENWSGLRRRSIGEKQQRKNIPKARDCGPGDRAALLKCFNSKIEVFHPNILRV